VSETLKTQLEQLLRQLLPLDAQTVIQFSEFVDPQTGRIETLLNFERRDLPALHFHLPKALHEIQEEDLVRVLVYRPGSSCAHAHQEPER